MNKAFEKILDRMDKASVLRANSKEHFNNPQNGEYVDDVVLMKDAIKIVNEVAEEYNGGWIACGERLPEEKLCEDGKYDPSEKVLIQLDNEEMFTSRYWSHRHSKDSDDFEKWIDLPDYYQDRVVAWQPLPEPYEDN